MNRGHHIHMAKVKAENERLHNQTTHQSTMQQSSDELAALKRRIHQLEAENKLLTDQNQRLIRLVDLH